MTKAPKITTAATIAKEKAARHRRVFRYPSSKADERFFRTEIMNRLSHTGQYKKEWIDFLFHLVWLRNDSGKTLKYCYFNERLQRVFLDRDFEKWANDARAEIAKVLNQINNVDKV